MGQRNLSTKDIEELDKDYKGWDGEERRKGPSYVNPEHDRRRVKWIPKNQRKE